MARKKLTSLTYETRFVARSHPEVFDATMDSLSELKKNRKVRFRNRPLSLEGYVNISLMLLNKMPIAERTQAVELMLSRLEAILMSSAEVPAEVDPDPVFIPPQTLNELVNSSDPIELGKPLVYVNGQLVEAEPAKPKRRKKTG